MIPSYSFVPSPNFKPGRERPVTAIVLHFTGGPTVESAVKWFQNPESHVSAHYVVGRNGDLVQMVLEQDTAWHAGKAILYGDRSVNAMSVGIEIVNWGELRKRGQEFFCWPAKNSKAPLGHPDREDYTRSYSVKIFGEPVLGQGFWWAPYAALQLVAVTKLCSELVKRYAGITPDKIVGHEYVSPGRKNDPGPLLDIVEIRRAAFKSRASSVISAPVPEDDIGDDQLYLSQADRSGNV